MLYDCAIIGGGPAGLNAALVLGRARRKVLLFDDNGARGLVTRESHGFLTRDGIQPREFRRFAQEELGKYPSVSLVFEQVLHADRKGAVFALATNSGFTAASRTLILAAGFREVLPSIPGIREFYGRSLFNCPYCDGWELRDKPLVLVSDGPHLIGMTKLLYNWSRDLLLCTNGWSGLTARQVKAFEERGIRLQTQPISALTGEEGRLEDVVFQDGMRVRREGGFVKTQWVQSAPFGYRLGCRVNGHGGFLTDARGRTSVPGVFAAGDTAVSGPTQQIIAAAEGSRAAMGVNQLLTDEDLGW
ncbi:FAD-dependent pyridine nucleotide-disulfide oxidoreductase [Paenibacillus mucilaginosus 3016]|uniref:FAD-dependent pyridine nucleotide-disulfide oxidoreductase n=1 Tax=Paenibacillus mucilaginosus 3016 TaxID=1116391 RepID=H6NNR9_9BACL|nr:NAD(P)/FAD-dependent oxidoreductase [Paenibacillus mucilaginosus]AFC30445.1 FAD-dependent pyridine nucleotide-disulfide oxidoreductase [Paenibacillus mucilaginosus 3016]WFA19076.1 NAD(P)/FAD-dependent oxidoreductase [Paenibacillus mucilaginosus]